MVKEFKKYFLQSMCTLTIAGVSGGTSIGEISDWAGRGGEGGCEDGGG